MTHHPQEAGNYGRSRVLILGGGDGALLKELLELPDPADRPRHVTMIELDEAVMEGCSKHMRSVCGPYLDRDNRTSENHKVICGDAIKFMQEAKAKGASNSNVTETFTCDGDSP